MITTEQRQKLRQWSEQLNLIDKKDKEEEAEQWIQAAISIIEQTDKQ